MKKLILIIGVLVFLNGITAAQEQGGWRHRAGGMWNTAKQQFGYGSLPEQDISRVNELENVYEQRRLLNNRDNFMEGGKNRTEFESTAHEEGERRGMHWGRREGAKNVILGAAVTYGAYLGGKALLNWYRGPLNHIKSELQALKDKTQALIHYVEKHDKKTSTPQMKAILEDSVSTKGSLSLKHCKNFFDVLKQAISEQEINDKKNKNVTTGLGKTSMGNRPSRVRSEFYSEKIENKPTRRVSKKMN